MSRYTVDQFQALIDAGRAKMCVKIPWPTPQLYCTPEYDHIDGSDVYIPRRMEGSQSPSNPAGLVISIDNGDNALSLAAYADDPTGYSINIIMLVRGQNDWTELVNRAMNVSACSWKGPTFTVSVDWEAGLKRKAALAYGEARCDLPFGGTICGYTGPLTGCAGTVSDCTTRGRLLYMWYFGDAPTRDQSFDLGDSSAQMPGPVLFRNWYDPRGERQRRMEQRQQQQQQVIEGPTPRTTRRRR